MQIQQRILHHSTPALPPRLYAHAPLSERSRYSTGSRNLGRMNDSGNSQAYDVINKGCRGQIEFGAKRRRSLSSTTALGPEEPHCARGMIASWFFKRRGYVFYTAR